MASLVSVPTVGSDSSQRASAVLSGYVFGSEEEQATGYWRKLHKEELRDLSSSPNIIQATEYRKTMMAVLVTRRGRGQGAGAGGRLYVHGSTGF